MARPSSKGALVVCLGLAAVSLLSVFPAWPARGQTPAAPLEERWRQVRQLRSAGQFDEALNVLDGIFTDFAGTEPVLRQAHCHRVFIYYTRGDSVQTRQAARDALARYPDLVADVAEFPPALNVIYGQLRGEMFGALDISAPVGGRVTLDGAYRGEIPLRLAYVPVGDYELGVTKDGYKEHRESVHVTPGRDVELSLSLTAVRGRKWWLVRVGPLVGAAVLGSIIASSGDDGPASLDELPLPPDPPQ